MNPTHGPQAEITSLQRGKCFCKSNKAKSIRQKHSVQPLVHLLLLALNTCNNSSYLTTATSQLVKEKKEREHLQKRSQTSQLLQPPKCPTLMNTTHTMTQARPLNLYGLWKVLNNDKCIKYSLLWAVEVDIWDIKTRAGVGSVAVFITQADFCPLVSFGITANIFHVAARSLWQTTNRRSEERITCWKEGLDKSITATSGEPGSLATVQTK